MPDVPTTHAQGAALGDSVCGFNHHSYTPPGGSPAITPGMMPDTMPDPRTAALVLRDRGTTYQLHRHQIPDDQAHYLAQQHGQPAPPPRFRWLLWIEHPDWRYVFPGRLRLPIISVIGISSDELAAAGVPRWVAEDVGCVLLQWSRFAGSRHGRSAIDRAADIAAQEG